METDYIVSSIDKLNEPYIPYPSIQTSLIKGYNIKDTVTDGFDIRAFNYFYFTSTNKDRVLFTKAGNMILQNMVYLTEYLTNKVDSLDEGEIITIYYGN